MEAGKAPLYVGVDVGGTNIATALVRRTGDIVARNRARTPRDVSGQKSLDAIIRTVEELLDKAGVAAKALTAIGLAVPGTIDPDEGTVIETPNVNLSGLRVIEPLKERFGCPVALGNDVDAGTLGEHWLGAARGASSVVGMFVGTGIGGGVIIDGKLVRGAALAAGEIGHIIMQVDGPRCECGCRGCLEAIASRTAIERDIRDAVASGATTVLTDMLDGDLSAVKSGALRRALDAGDPLVTEIMGRASEVIGLACVSVRHLLDPEVIVLGGGVMEACADFVLPIVEEVLARGGMRGAKPHGAVVLSALGDDAGVLGAAMLARESVGDHAAAEALSAYPVIAGTRFGEVTIGGKVYKTDVVIRADGQVKKRKKAIAKKAYGTSHKIGAEELKRVCKGGAQLLVVGTGQSGAAEVTEGGRRFLLRRGIEFREAPTPQAIVEYNDAEGRKAALLHVTC